MTHRRMMGASALRRWRATAGALVAPIALALGGCFSTPTPDVRVVSARVVDRTKGGAVISVEIEGANHTTKDMKIRDIRYWLSLDGKRVFEGRRTPQATFSALGVQSFHVPASAPVDRLPSQEQAKYRFGAIISYLVPGPLAESLYDLDLRRPSVHVRGSGVIDLRPDAAPTPKRPDQLTE